MNIKIKIKEKQQLLFIALGSVIGFLLSNYMELDTVQTLQESTRILGEELSVQSALSNDSSFIWTYFVQDYLMEHIYL